MGGKNEMMTHKLTCNGVEIATTGDGDQKSFDEEEPINICDKNGSAYEVGICPFCKQHQLRLRNHLKTCHSRVVCTECSLTFPDRISLGKHARIHKQNYSISCPLCESKFARKVLLRVHLMHAHWNRPMDYDCSRCGAKFRLYRDILDHSKKCGQSLVCERCPYVAWDENYLKKHMEKHCNINKIGDHLAIGDTICRSGGERRGKPRTFNSIVNELTSKTADALLRLKSSQEAGKDKNRTINHLCSVIEASQNAIDILSTTRACKEEIKREYKDIQRDPKKNEYELRLKYPGDKGNFLDLTKTIVSETRTWHSQFAHKRK
jgi:DNA-directed RNA polymerase subunit RPC12/RpoP